MMKLAVLYFSFSFNKMQKNIMTPKGIGKIGIVSFIGTIMEMIGFVLGNNYGLLLFLVNVLEIPLMFLVILGREKKSIITLVVSGYFFTILINGVLEALWNQFGETGSYIFFLLFSCGVVAVGARIWRNYSKLQKGIFEVELYHQGKSIHMSGFYDSGNQLRDPYTEKGVHIVSERRLNELSVMEGEISPNYIPYQVLGNTEALLEVYYIDVLVVKGDKGKITFTKCPVGVTKDNLFEGKKYEIILNEEVF